MRKDTIIGSPVVLVCLQKQSGCRSNASCFSWRYRAGELATDRGEGKVIGGNGKQKNERKQEKQKKNIKWEKII